ncbi:branched-chain amino acid ABC transporter substrate-binding protein, partial [Morganella morganii]|nr:branched-chain amino acid ABC transporter substrate-binding protein [Morganella morganii]
TVALTASRMFVPYMPSWIESLPSFKDDTAWRATSLVVLVASIVVDRLMRDGPEVDHKLAL